MAERSSSNVLAFSAHYSGPKQRIAPETSNLLGLCRDRLAHGVATAFAENLGKANDDLLGMADRATSLEQQQLAFASMDFLTNRGQVLLQQFRAVYVTQFDANLVNLRQGQRNSGDELGELRLVETDDFERDLAVGKLSARAACNCANQLTAIDRRLAALLGVPRISHDDNPLYPRALFNAMLSAFEQMGVGEQLSLTLLHQFERQTSVELPGIYADLNRHLVESGVLPNIPVGLPRPTQRSEVQDEPGTPSSAGVTGQEVKASESNGGEPHQSATAAMAAMAGLDAGQAAYGQMYPADQRLARPGTTVLPAGADEVFAELARAIQAATSTRLRTAIPSPQMAQPYGMAQSARPRSDATALGVAQLIEALTSLQRGRTDTRHLPGLGAVQIDPGGGKVLQQLRATPMVSWSHPVDALTIDIVAMLFDAIFNDPDLPATLRAEIARLQIPILKVALMDKAFFSNKRHPARRLLDAIASAAIGRSDVDEPRLMAKIHSIVSDVVAGFDTDIDIFATQVAKLDEFLQDEDARAQTRATPVVTKLERRDRQEAARDRVDTEIEARIHRRAVPTLVADFITRHWRLVLLQVFVRHGDQGAPWVDALGALDDLLWSVKPKQNAEERNRLLTTLPDLLKRLRLGLEATDLGDAWDPFFAQLIRLHVGALHKDIPEDAYEPAPQVPTEAQSEDSETAPGLKTLALVDTPSRIEYHTDAARQKSQTKPPAPVNRKEKDGSGDRFQDLAQSLQVGAWVEFESFRGTKKTLRLSWVSDFRGVFLFTNRQGENALTLATTSLAEHLRKGTARVLSQERLTERAVAQLLQKSPCPPRAPRHAPPIAERPN